MLSAFGLLEKFKLVRCSKDSRQVTFDEPSANPLANCYDSVNPHSCHSGDLFPPLLRPGNTSSPRWITPSAKSPTLIPTGVSHLIFCLYFHHSFYSYKFLVPIAEKGDSLSFSRPVVYSIITIPSLWQICSINYSLNFASSSSLFLISFFLSFLSVNILVSSL